jgi:hypothetical protein
MSPRGKKTVWIAIAFVVVFLLFVVSTTFQGDRVGVEVCMVFRGQRDCRKAQAKDRRKRSAPPSPTPARNWPAASPTPDSARTRPRNRSPGGSLPLHVKTCYTFSVASRNITLALPEELVRRLKILAARQDTSISALLTATLSDLADQEEGYAEARDAMIGIGVYASTVYSKKGLVTVQTGKRRAPGSDQHRDRLRRD